MRKLKKEDKTQIEYGFSKLTY